MIVVRVVYNSTHDVQPCAYRRAVSKSFIIMFPIYQTVLRPPTLQVLLVKSRMCVCTGMNKLILLIPLYVDKWVHFHSARRIFRLPIEVSVSRYGG
jgi:hypothetical protein